MDMVLTAIAWLIAFAVARLLIAFAIFVVVVVAFAVAAFLQGRSTR